MKEGQAATGQAASVATKGLTMRRVAAVAGVLVLTVAVVDAGKTPPDIPINLWLAADGQAVTSDGQQVFANGVWADYVDGLQNVLAIIQGGGNFRFSTQSNTRQAAQRSVDVNFGSQTPNPQIPFFPNGLSEQRVNITEPMHGFPLGTETAAVATLHPGQSTLKLVRWDWEADGYAYHLGYGTDYNVNNIPDSPPVSVNCIAPQGQPTAACTKWTLTPVAAAGYSTDAGTNVANGTAIFWRAKVLKNGEASPEFIGYYVMPFSETFTRK